MAVRGGRIVAVGDRAADVDRLRGPRTRRIDLAGRTLLPSFQDAHVHPAMAGIGLTRCPLHDLAAGRRRLPRGDPGLRAGPPRPAVGDRRRLVHERLSGWDADPPGARPGRPRSTGLLRQSRRPRRLGQLARARAGRDRPGLDRPGLGPDRAGARRRPERHPPRRGHGHRPGILPPTTIEDLAAGLELAQAYLHRLGISAWQDAWVDGRGPGGLPADRRARDA